MQGSLVFPGVPTYQADKLTGSVVFGSHSILCASHAQQTLFFVVTYRDYQVTVHGRGFDDRVRIDALCRLQFESLRVDLCGRCRIRHEQQRQD